MDKVHALNVTLETVTPLFLGGADPRAAPELRAPPFRGAMRYWLRAVLGGVIGDQNPNGLRELESAVFGSTENGSPILIRLSGNPSHSAKKILPHKDGRAAGARSAFDASQQFQLLMRQLRTNDQTTWECACAALNLAITFGGVGLRSRRGYGTLRIVQVSPGSNSLSNSPVTVANWEKHIGGVLTDAINAAHKLAQMKRIQATSLPRAPTRFPCASTNNLIRLSKLPRPHNGSAMAAVTHLMSVIPKDPAFGGISPRQASPLWVKPLQVENGYALLFTILASNIKPAPNYGAIRKWLDTYFPGKEITVQGWNQ